MHKVFASMGLNKVWLVVVTLILLKGWWCTDGCWEQERIALLQLKPFFMNSFYLNDWVEGEETSDCCLWERVECNSTIGRVIQLDLSHVRNWGLGEWYLNATLFLPFEKLKTLRLAENQIAGWVENEGFEILSSKLSNLEVLDLSYNSFGENIFSSLSRFSWLTSLNLAGNNFKRSSLNSGVARLRRLINLEFLDLSGNNFNNSILSILGGFSSLKSLYISDNQLKGSIQIKDALCNLEELGINRNEIEKFVAPKDKRCLSKLKVLYLGGVFPNKSILPQSLELYTLTHLEELYLDDSTLQINFLQSLGALTSLKNLSLTVSELNGTLTAQDLPNFKNLESLYLDYTTLNNSFLQTIGEMNSLKVLRLYESGLNDTLLLAQGLCKLIHLQVLDISFNDLGGNLPECLANLTSLQCLDLSSNQFTGNLPKCLANLTSLQSLDLSGNQFTGNLSECLANLTSLQSLDLSSNQFTGNLPKCLANLISLHSLDLSFNQFTGNIAESPLKSLTSIQSLSLSYNHFQIPISLLPFFNHSKLKYFNGNNNEIYAEIESHSLVPKFQLNEIGLSCYGRGGAIPKFLYHQHELKGVYLSDMNLMGEFPNWLLENNTGLSNLYLVNNSLSGPFHLPIHPHMNLKLLDISNNFFYGQIPADYGAYMPKLRSLHMSMNAFNDSIPSSFGDMNSLAVLDLSNNHLSGRIPEHLAMGCFSLKQLILSNNILQGQIFSANVNLTSLQLLQLDGNHFTGRIPYGLSNCSYLNVLDISNNHLSGRIPWWVGNMSNLRHITMHNNLLEGPLPMEFCKLDLEFFDLSENNISGNIPSCFSPPRINRVRLSKNRLQGPLKDAFYNSSSMVTLDLSNNHLTGSIPDWIDRLSQLSYLLLHNNDLEGEIPIQLCQLNQLSLIDFSHNNFSGRIPRCLNVTTLEEVTATPNSDPNAVALAPISVSTQEPVEFTTKSESYSYQGRILTYMSGIDLSCNKLTGEIPNEIGNLSKIHVLNLSHNSLSGPIPPTFVNLGQIESLDLSNNNLSGKIPPELVELNFLEVFSVAHNNLSGKIPETAQFATFDNSSYEANPLLCGTPLSKSCGPPSLMPRASTDSEENSGFIDMDIFYLSFTVTYIIVLLGIAAVLYINPYWRRVWFYYIEKWITSCYYFVVDNLPMRFRFGNI